MLNTTDRPALIVLLGEEAPTATYNSIARLADRIMAKFGQTSADVFLSGITDYDVRVKKITAIKDLRDAIRFGNVEGEDGLKWCKDAVEAWVVANPAPLAEWERDLLNVNRDPWANVSREAQYGYGDSYADDEPPF